MANYFNFDPTVNAQADEQYNALQEQFAQEEAQQAAVKAAYEADPIGFMEAEKARRVAEKQARMMPLRDLRVPDMDNLSGNNGAEYDPKKNFRLTGSDMGFDAYETKKSTKWFNSLDKKSQEAYARKINKQMLALDRANGLPAGTSTIEDVYAKGAEQQDMLNTIVDKKLLENPDAMVEMVPTGKQDKSGGKRNIVKPMIDGKNLIDPFANDPKQNAGYFERFNDKSNRRKEELARAGAIKYIAPDQMTDYEANSTYGHIKQGLTRAQAGAIDIGFASMRTIASQIQKRKDALYGTTARDKAMAKEIKQDELDGIKLDKEQKKFLRGEEYDYPYWDAKYGKNSPESKKKKGFFEKAGNALGDTLEVATGAKQLDTTLGAIGKAFGFNNGKNRAREAKSANSLDDFKEALKEHDGSDLRKTLNTTADQYKANENRRTAIEHSKNYDAIKNAYKKHDIIGTLEGLASEAKTWGKEAGNIISDPGYGVEHFMGSAPHMAMNMTVAGVAVNFANTLDEMDYNYKKNHGGKSATGIDKLGQVAASTAIVAVQKGTSEVMLSGLAKKMGFKPTTIKTKYSTYNAYVPEGLSKVATGKASTFKYTPKMEKQIDKFFNSAATKLAFSKNKTLNSLAKGLGTTSYDLGKRMFYTSMALGVNAGRVATGMGAEYGEEFVESVLGDLGNNIGTDKSIDVMKAHMSGLMGAAGGYGGKVATVGIRTGKEALVSGATKSLYTGNKVQESPFNTVTFENEQAKTNILGSTRKAVTGEKGVTDTTAPSALPGQAVDPRAVDPKYTYDPEKDTVEKFTGEDNAIDDLIANPHKVGNAGEVVTEHMLTALQHQAAKVKETTDEDAQLDEYEKLSELKTKFEEFQKSQKEYIANINKPTSEKKVEEYDELDVANHIVEHGGLDDETIAKLESRGVLSKQAKAITQKLRDITYRGEQLNSITITSNKITNGNGHSEIAKEDRENSNPKNDTGPSLKDYNKLIARAIADGDIKKAEKLTKSLKDWAKLHTVKGKVFVGAAKKGAEAKWQHGKQKFSERATKSLAKVIPIEAELIQAHADLAEHALASAKLRQQRVTSAANTTTSEAQARAKSLLAKILESKKGKTDGNTSGSTNSSTSTTDNNTNSDGTANTDTGSTGIVSTIAKNFAKITGKEGSRTEKVTTLFKGAVTAVLGNSKTTQELSANGTNVVADGSKLTAKDVLGVVMPRAFGPNATLKTKEDFTAKVAEIRASVKQAIDNGVNTIVLDKTDPTATPEGSSKGNTRLDVTLRKAGFVQDDKVKGLWTRKNNDKKIEVTEDSSKETLLHKSEIEGMRKEAGPDDLWVLADEIISGEYNVTKEILDMVKETIEYQLKNMKKLDLEEFEDTLLEARSKLANVVHTGTTSTNTTEDPGSNDSAPNTTDPAVLLDKKEWNKADISDAQAIVDNAEDYKAQAKAQGAMQLLSVIQQINKLKKRLEAKADNKTDGSTDNKTDDNTDNKTEDNTDNEKKTKDPAKVAKVLVKQAKKAKTKKQIAKVLKEHPKNLMYLLANKVDKKLIAAYKKAIAVLKHESKENGTNPTGSSPSSIITTDLDYSKVEHGDDIDNASETGILTEEYIMDQIEKHNKDIGLATEPEVSSVPDNVRNKRTTEGESRQIIDKETNKFADNNVKQRAHNAKAFLEADIRNGKELAEWLLANVNKSSRVGTLDKVLLKSVLRYFEKVGNIPRVEIEVIGPKSDTDKTLWNLTKDNDKVSPGTFYPATNTVVIRVNKKFPASNTVYGTAIHELIHAASVFTIKNDKALHDEIAAIIKHIEEVADPQELLDPNRVKLGIKDKEGNPIKRYGLKDPYEFIAELAKPGFREFLATLPAMNEKASYRNFKGLLGNVMKVFHRVMGKILKTKYVDNNVLMEALRMYDKASLNGLTNEQDVVSSMFDLQIKGKLLGTGVKAITNIEKNLDLKHRKLDRVGAFSIFHNALSKIDTLAKKYGLTEVQQNFLHSVRAFSANQRTSIKATIASFDPKKGRKDKWLKNKALLSIADGDLANLSDNWFHAIGTQSVRFLAEEANRMQITSYDQIRGMFKLGDGAKIDPDIANALFNAGMKLNDVARNLGKNIATELNIRQSRFAEDPAFYDKLIMDLGTVALVSMRDMGLVDFTPVSQNFINKLLPKSRQSKDTKAYVMFVKPRMEYDVDTNTMQPVTALSELQQMYKDKEGADTLAAIGSAENNSKGKEVQDEPLTEKDVPKNIKKTFMKAPKAFIKSIVNASKMRWKINTTRHERWDNIHKDVQAQILGIQNPDDHLDIYKESIIGKNTSILRSIETLSDFVNKRSEKGTLDKTFSLIPTIWGQMRMGYRERDINFQQDKLHRQMVVGDSWNKTYDTSNTADMDLFDQVMQVRLGKSWKDFVNEDGTFVHDSFEKAMQVLNGERKGKKVSQSVAEALEIIGEDIEGFAILTNLIDLSQALKDKGSFESTLYVEPDGNTNGSITASMQTVLDRNDSNFRRATEAGGIFSEGSMFSTLTEHKRENLDNYQDIIKRMAEKLMVKMPSLAQKYGEDLIDAFNTLDTMVLAPMTEKGDPNAITKQGRNWAKPFVMTFIYSKQAASMNRDTVDILEEAIYEFIDKNQDNKKALAQLDKALDTLNKASQPKDRIKLPNLVKLQEAGALKTVRLGNIEFLLKPMSVALKGDPVVSALEESYESLVNVRNLLNTGFLAAYHYAAKIYEIEYENAKWAKAEEMYKQAEFSNKNKQHYYDLVELNTEETDALINKLIKAGLMPSLKHATSETHADSLLLTNMRNVDTKNNSLVPLAKPLDTEILDDIDKDGEPVYRTQVTNENKINKDGSRTITEKEGINTITNTVSRRVFSAEGLGFRKFVNTILSFDGNVQAKGMRDKRIGEFGNIHDAIIVPGHKMSEATVAQNENYIHLMAQWDMLEESLTTLERIEKAAQLYMEQHPDTKGKFKDIPTKKGKKVVQLGEVLTKFRPLVKSHVKQKLMHLKELTNVEQFEAYEVRHDAKNDKKLQEIIDNKIIEAENKYGISFDDQGFDDISDEEYENAISYKSQDYFTKQTKYPVSDINPATVSENFDALRQLDINLSSRIDPEHSRYLESLVQGMSQHLKSVADSIKLEVYKGKSKVSNIAKVKASKNKVKLSISDGMGIDDNRGVESNQEAFARGYIEAVVNNAVLANKSLQSDLTKLFNNIMDRKDITWEDLLYAKDMQHYTDEAKELAENLAKDRFDQIFFEKNLGKFVGLVLTNKNVMNKLSTINPNSSYSNSTDLTPFQRVNNALLTAKDTISSNTTNDVMKDVLADALNTKNKFNTKLAEFHPLSDELNQKAHKIAKKQLYDRVVNAVDKIDPNHSFFNKKTLLHKVAAPIKAIGSLAVIGVDVYHNPELVEYYVDIAKDINKQFGEFFNNMKLEFLGETDKNSKFHTLLRKVKHHVDAQQNVIASGTTDQLRAAFLKENRPTKEQWASINRTVVGSDLGVLFGNYDTAEVLNIIRNKDSMQAEIDLQMDKIRRILPSRLHNAIDVHTTGLAHFMRTKENKVEGLRVNASSMGQMFISEAMLEDGSLSDQKLLINAIDMAVTMKALQMNNNKDIKYLYETMKAEANNPKNGIVMVAEMHQAAQEMHRNLLHREKAKRIKGDIRQTHTNNYQSIIVPKKDIQKKLDEGYVLYKNVTANRDDHVIMYTNKTNYGKYITGIVAISTDSYGKTVAYTPDRNLNLSRARFDENKIYPVVAASRDNKMEEIVHTPQAIYDIGGSEIDASILIGNDMAYTTTSSKATKYNKQAVKALFDDYQKQVTNENNKLIPFNHKTHPELWNTLPYAFKKDLIEKFGHENSIKIDRDYITLVFGFKTRSLANLVGNDHETTKKVIHHAEKIWQQIVSRAKEHVVIYTPQVLVSNVISNAVLSTVQGIPPGYMFREQKNALKAVSDYRRTLAKRDNTERELRMKSNKNDIFLKKKLKKLNNLLESNVVHKLVSEGVFTSYIEDIDNTDTPILGTIDEAIADFRKDGKNRVVRNLAEKGTGIPYVGAAYKNLVITKDTNLAKDLRYATQVSDFVARYAMYKYRTEVQNKGHDESIREIMETFINYEWNTSNELQWVNDMGIMMYTKFLFRIQKVLMKSFRDRPINNVASILLQDATMNVPDISDSFITGAFGTGRVNSPVDIVDDAFEFNLLHYLPFF